jgi:pimeloyl-ACP methyl ester carboxylesterase
MASDSGLRLAGWTSPERRDSYVRAYRKAQELWGAPVADLEIPTRFGPTHALASGPEDAAPLFLLHAAFNTGAIQWYPNVGRLSRDRRVVALDFVGAPGLSSQTAPIVDRGDCARWLSDVVDSFGLNSCDLVGSSQGGWLSLNLAMAQPRRVSKLVLLAPAASFLRFRRAASISIRLGPFMPGWTAGPSLKPVFGKRHRVDDRIVALLEKSLRHYRFQERPVIPDVFSDQELRLVRARTLVMYGDKEIICDPRPALSRAESLLQNVQTALVPDVGHLLNIELPEYVDRRILDFLGSVDSTRTSMPASPQ